MLNNKKILYIFILFMGTLPQAVIAQNASYLFPKEKRIKHITALLFDEKKVSSVTPLQTYPEDKTIFHYETKENDQELSLAFAITPTGEFLTSNVVSTSNSNPSEKELPTCRTRLSLASQNYNQGQLFESLITLRQKRKTHILKKIETLKNLDLLTRLSKLESNFGFQHNTPLSIEMPQRELTDRLDALNHTIKLYKTYKK